MLTASIDTCPVLIEFPFPLCISFATDEPIKDKKVVAEEIPAASTPVRRKTPRAVGRIFIDAHIKTWEALSNSG